MMTNENMKLHVVGHLIVRCSKYSVCNLKWWYINICYPHLGYKTKKENKNGA